MRLLMLAVAPLVWCCSGRGLRSHRETLGSASPRCSDEVCGCVEGDSESRCVRKESCKGVGVACRDKALEALNDRPLLEKKVYHRCAVVSSSDALLEDRFGQEIDSYDAVFRINMSPVVGLETFVGSQTTVAMTNAPSWGYGKFDRIINAQRFVADLKTQLGLDDKSEPKGPPVRVVIQDPLIADDAVKCCYPDSSQLMRPKVHAILKHCKEVFAGVPGVTCEVLDSTFVDRAWRAVCAVHTGHCPMGPSSGLVTIVYAHALCNSVKLFGFDLNSNHFFGHYYNPKRQVEDELHPSREHSLIQAWNTTLPDDLFAIADSHTSPCPFTGKNKESLAADKRHHLHTLH